MNDDEFDDDPEARSRNYTPGRATTFATTSTPLAGTNAACGGYDTGTGTGSLYAEPRRNLGANPAQTGSVPVKTSLLLIYPSTRSTPSWARVVAGLIASAVRLWDEPVFLHADMLIAHGWQVRNPRTKRRKRQPVEIQRSKSRVTVALAVQAGPSPVIFTSRHIARPFDRGTSMRLTRIASALLALLTVGALCVVIAPTATASGASTCGYVLKLGSAWLGGQGVDVHSNGQRQASGQSCAGSSTSNKAVQDGNGWQCVELAARLYYVRGWGNIKTSNGSSYTIPQGSSGVTSYKNGSGYIPVPGDLIIEGYSSAHTDGHVAVIDTVQGSTITALDQNGSKSYNPLRSYTLTGSNISGGQTPVTYVVHSPNNHNSNSSGTVLAVNSAGALYGKQGFNGQWATLSAGAEGAITSAAVDGDGGVILAVNSAGALYGKQGFNGAWTALSNGPQGNITSAAVDGDGGVILAVNSAGALYGKQGFNGQWATLSAGAEGAITSAAVDGDGGVILAVNSAGALYGKQGFNGQWATLSAGAEGAITSAAVDGDGGVILAVNSAGALYGKQGYNGAWTVLSNGPQGNITGAAVDGDGGVILAVNSAGALYGKQGFNGAWTVLSNGPQGNITGAAVDGDGGVILAVNSAGALYGKQGFNGAWTALSNGPQGNITKAFANLP